MFKVSCITYCLPRENTMYVQCTCTLDMHMHVHGHAHACTWTCTCMYMYMQHHVFSPVPSASPSPPVHSSLAASGSSAHDSWKYLPWSGQYMYSTCIVLYILCTCTGRNIKQVASHLQHVHVHTCTSLYRS